ncbi:MAG TPA: response regulator [Candidatus Angelobacter sp.]|nr:response regulator [Candidatus Angelobacter sp.]
MRPLKILHVDDSDEDLMLFGRACEAAGLPAKFHCVKDGHEAIAYLKGEGIFDDRNRHPLPDLIVLDLNLPGMGGFDFLKWVQGEPNICPIPVLVFTISANVADKARAMAEGAAGYFVKPRDFESMVHLAESVLQFKRNGWCKNDQPKNDDLT